MTGRMRFPFLVALRAAALFSLLLAACGGDDDENGGASQATAASPTSTQGGEEPAATVGDLEIMAPFARGTLDRGAVFFTVVNNGDTDDALVAANADIAGRTELHETTMQDGQAMMQPVDQIDVPAGGEAVLEPGGLHVMLLDLPEPLEVGQTFTVTLTFENAGEVELTVEVTSYSDEPMQGDTMGDNGGSMR